MEESNEGGMPDGEGGRGEPFPTQNVIESTCCRTRSTSLLVPCQFLAALSKQVIKSCACFGGRGRGQQPVSFYFRCSLPHYDANSTLAAS